MIKNWRSKLKLHKKHWQFIKKINYGYIFILPWIIGFLVFTLYPLIASLHYSFSDVLITPRGVKLLPIGWDNYIYALTLDVNFLNALKETALELLLQIPLIIVISILIATLLNQQLKGRSFFRTLYFLPVIVISGPIIDYFVKLNLLGNTAIEEQSWYLALSASSFILVKIILYLLVNVSTILWFSGISILSFLIVIQRIDNDLYEAAEMDGAASWEKFWKVTFPELKVGINLNIIYLVVFISTFADNSAMKIIKENMFKTSDPGGLGYAAMQGWVFMVIMLFALGILLLVVNGIPKRRKG